MFLERHSFVLWILLIFFVFVVNGAGQIISIKGETDLTQGAVRQYFQITLRSGVETFYWCIPSANASSVARISAWGTLNKAVAVERLSSVPSDFDNKKWEGYVFWSIPTANLGVSTTIKLNIVFVDSFISFPRTIKKQSEHHYVIYYGNAMFGFPYKVDTVTASYALPGKALSYTSGGKLVGKVLQYGPYTNVAAFASLPIHIHFLHDGPFLVASSVKRILQVSHWGMMGVEEEYTLVNAAAKFIGSFSRQEYEVARKVPTIVTRVSSVISQSASDIYFRDVIGNISTSSVHSLSNKQIRVDLIQRYPMLGGWQSNFFWGYNIPLSKIVTLKNGQYSLKFPFAHHIRDVHAKQMDVEIRLPEGATDITATVGLSRPPFEFRRTVLNLDIIGRPTIVFNATDIVSPDHAEFLVVSYRFSLISMLLEPLLLTVGFLSFFIASMVYVRVP